MVLPEAQANEEWAQSGGNAFKSVGHPALGAALGPLVDRAAERVRH